MREEPPEDVRLRSVTADSDLIRTERETTITFPRDRSDGLFFSEIRSHIRWVQSIDAADINWVRTNDDGKIVAINAVIPKGFFRFQSSGRKSDNDSQMVSKA